VYSYLICDFWGLRDISVGDYQLISHDCEDFSDDIESPSTSTIFSNFIHEFDQKIYSAINAYLLSLVNPQSYPCGFSAYIQITFYTASCYRYCIAYVSGTEIVGVTKAACGVECCEYQTSWCFDQLGNPVQINAGFAPPYPPSCDKEEILDDLVPCAFSARELVVWETDCMYRCLEPEH
jgi:hypothetical protein